MKLNDSTILRIKVPAHLYESVKQQLTLKEAQNFGMPGAKTVKVKDSSSGDKPKKTAAPKASKPAAPKKAEDAKDAPKDGHKKMGLDELKALAEMLKGHIAEMEKEEEGKKPVEEEKEEEGEKMEEAKEDLKEYEVIYVVENGRCYRKDDEGNMDEVSMTKCR